MILRTTGFSSYDFSMDHPMRITLHHRLLLLLALAVSLLPTQPLQAQQKLSINPADCVLVMPGDLPPGDKQFPLNIEKARSELVYHFKLVFGSELPVLQPNEPLKPGQFAFRIGVIPAADTQPLGWQETRHLIAPDGVWLYGDPTNHGISDLFALYDFLEKQLDIHWLQPGESGIVYQKRETLELTPGQYGWNPKLVFRKIRQGIRHNQPHRPINRPTTDAFLITDEEHNRLVDEEMLWIDRMRMGGQRPGGGHAFSKWWPQYGQSHPEYFALTSSGKREPMPLPKGKERSEEFIKICPSNPDVAQRLIDEWLPRKDTQQYISTGPNDGTQHWCECEKCKALDVRLPGEPFATHLTDRYVHLANEVARRARQHRPDAYATIYAYLTTLYPPRKLKLEPNVAVQIVPYVIPLKLSVNRELFKGWKDAGATKLAIRPNYHHKYMGGSLPPGIEKQMFDVFQEAVENGAISADYDMLMDNWAVTGMSDYILAKAMVDPSQPFEHWEDEYCSGYGQASEDVKQYYRYWRKEVWDARLLPAIDDIAGAGRAGFFVRGLMWTLASNDYYRPSDFDQTDAFLKTARTRDLTAREKARVDELILTNQHARLVFLAAISKGQESYTRAHDLMAFRKAHKNDINLSWVRLIGQEDLYNWTAIGTAEYLKAYPLPWLMTGMAWRFRMDPQYQGLGQHWQATPYDQATEWEQLRTDSFWERAYDSETEPGLKKRLANYDGTAWYLTRIATPHDFKGRNIYLYFGGVGDTATVYLNGKEVGSYTAASEKEKSTPFEIQIDKGINWNDSFQNITVKVENKSGLGGLYNRVWLVSREKQAAAN